MEEGLQWLFSTIAFLGGGGEVCNWEKVCNIARIVQVLLKPLSLYGKYEMVSIMASKDTVKQHILEAESIRYGPDEL